jgi:hypothetical protein
MSVSEMSRASRRYKALIAAVLVGSVLSAGGVYAFAGTGGPARVSPQILPLAHGLYRARTLTNCSPERDIGYLPNQPCDTYVLILSHQPITASSLLANERAWLKRAQWRHVRRAKHWGYGSSTDGWIASQHAACAIVVNDKVGLRVERRWEGTIAQPPGVDTFLRAAKRAAHAPALYALVQPGMINGGPRC